MSPTWKELQELTKKQDEVRHVRLRTRATSSTE